jgi:hypothetical protein
MCTRLKQRHDMIDEQLSQAEKFFGADASM